MEFRPCIDIHNGKVKQIIGDSLKDKGDFVKENFVSDESAEWYAKLYKNDGIRGAHVIMLNSQDSDYFPLTQKVALDALRAYPGGLAIGGGINDKNAAFYLAAGAGWVIVTSFAFAGGEISFDNLKALKQAAGRTHIMLDLSCKEINEKFFVTTNRWQNLTNIEVTPRLFEKLSDYCVEFLVHGADSEGKLRGTNPKLIKLLGECAKKVNVPITYAGGITTYDDIENIREYGEERLNFTVGTSLDLFGGELKYRKIVDKYN